MAGFCERTGVIAPFGLVEIGSQKVASIIFEQRIDTDHYRACQMAKDDVVGHLQQLALVAVAAFDPWFLADPRTPLVRAGRCIAGLAAFAFPAQRVDVGTASEQATKEGELATGVKG